MRPTDELAAFSPLGGSRVRSWLFGRRPAGMGSATPRAKGKTARRQRLWWSKTCNNIQPAEKVSSFESHVRVVSKFRILNSFQGPLEQLPRSGLASSRSSRVERLE